MTQFWFSHKSQLRRRFYHRFSVICFQLRTGPKASLTGLKKPIICNYLYVTHYFTHIVYCHLPKITACEIYLPNVLFFLPKTSFGKKEVVIFFFLVAKITFGKLTWAIILGKLRYVKCLQDSISTSATCLNLFRFFLNSLYRTGAMVLVFLFSKRQHSNQAYKHNSDKLSIESLF